MQTSMDTPGLVKDIVIVMRGLEKRRQTTAAKGGRRGGRTRHKTREVLVFTWKKKIKATDS
jgi:hypothetical protein